MNINWKLKSAAFSAIDALGIHRALYFAQKHITKRAVVRIDSINANWITHTENLQGLSGEAPVLEFGAGQSLQQNIFLSRTFKRQVVVDLFSMLDFSQADGAAQQISRLDSEIEYAPIGSLSDLKDSYGITYKAPVDMRASPFGDGEFAACVSTNTLEHIPKSDVTAIFLELRRVIRPGGLVSAVIDYSDHYAHTDRSIGQLNYLQFTSDEFRKFNHRVHFQNRLRHSDYVEIFRATGFALIKAEAGRYADPPQAIAAEFDRTDPTICATRGVFLLANP